MTEHTPPHDELDPAKLERLLADVTRLPREVAPRPDAWPAVCVGAERRAPAARRHRVCFPRAFPQVWPQVRWPPAAGV